VPGSSGVANAGEEINTDCPQCSRKTKPIRYLFQTDKDELTSHAFDAGRNRQSFDGQTAILVVSHRASYQQFRAFFSK
jgi:hypothetical protein